MELGRLESISIRHFGSNFLIKNQSVNLSLRTGFVRRANIIMEFRPGNASGGPPLCHPAISLSNFASTALTIAMATATPSPVTAMGEMGVKGHQHKSIHAQVKQVNPPKFKLRVVPKSICQVNRLSLDTTRGSGKRR
ncbi:hypothetical protein B0H13DRAFT_1877431 [Mycena leptocephala]|nr:hypothetical protein B0H13DRAFT_1877431 [Mycena leptocephala]